MPGGGAYPDLLVAAKGPVGGGRDAAVIVAVEDYAGLPDRPGASAMAAAWYRYFRVERGLEPTRIRLLRGAEATPRRIARAVEAARRGARDGALWFVFVGHVGSEVAGESGTLWLAGGDGTRATAAAHAYPVARLLGRVAFGRHAQAVVVLDGCLAGAGAGRSGTWTSLPPRFVRRRGAPPREASVAGQWGREPADVAVFAAGLGSGCVEDLPGTRFPALSYWVLGGLRGWADADGDGVVGAVEVLTLVTRALRAAGATAPRPSLHGADLRLARRVGEAGPALAGLRAPVAAGSDGAGPGAAPLWVAEAMVRVERGAFVMGCARGGDRACEADERPRRVRLSAFFVDRREVTQAEYQGCVAAGACRPVDPARCYVWTGASFVRGTPLPEPLTRAEHPVVCVDWAQAASYCAAMGKRLPTEAEWERAAAGVARRRYPWGDAPPSCERARFDGCGEHTRPVGERRGGATPEGVEDLAGNAAEWVFDWYAKGFPAVEGRDPRGPDRGRVRVVRGGSFYDAPELLRSSYRYGLTPGVGFSTVGFRCAR
jgi:formylglycine-generating enzyme required for sulfatase activity